MQEGEDLKHLKVSALCKHYFDYNLEDWYDSKGNHYNRDSFDAKTPLIDLADTFLPAF